MTVARSFVLGIAAGFARYFSGRAPIDDDVVHMRHVHSAHQRCWSALDELVSALVQMPAPPPGRLADAIADAKAARDRNLPW